MKTKLMPLPIGTLPDYDNVDSKIPVYAYSHIKNFLQLEEEPIPIQRFDEILEYAANNISSKKEMYVISKFFLIPANNLKAKGYHQLIYVYFKYDFNSSTEMSISYEIKNSFFVDLDYQEQPININIDTLVGKLNIESENIKVDKADFKNRVSDLLNEAIKDFTIKK